MLSLNRSRIVRVLAFLIVLGLAISPSSLPETEAQQPQPTVLPTPDQRGEPQGGLPLTDSCGGTGNPNANTCCGYYSAGNPYYCCDDDETGDDLGNCTWWAWREYKRVTGQSVPCGGSAKLWKACAEPNGSPPRVNSVVVLQPGVYGAKPPNGHVGFVTWVDNPSNPTQFKYSNLRCSGPCGVYMRGPKTVVTGVNFIYPPCSDNTAPNNPTSVSSPSHTLGQWSNNVFVTAQWSGATDPGSCPSGIGGYSWSWTQNANTLPDTQQESDENTSQTISPGLAYGQNWYFHIRTRDKTGNWASGAVHYGPFWIDPSLDTNPPNNPSTLSSSDHVVGQWSNDNTIGVQWAGAVDPPPPTFPSGVHGYSWLWSQNATDLPDNVMEVGGSPQTSLPLGDGGAWYFHIRTRDVAGNWNSEAQTGIFHLGPFRIDTTLPAGTFNINNGSDVTYQIMVDIHVDASDTGSGLYQMHLANNSGGWHDWQPFEPDFWWMLDNSPNTTQTVHIELRDQASNTITLPPQMIYFDLSGEMPRSDNYQILTDVQGRGGGQQSSTNYQLVHTVGETIAGKGIASQLYILQSGFHGAWVAGSAPLPTPTPTPQVTTTPTNTPTPTSTPTPTPTASPTPTPPPQYYGVSINQAALFTHDYQVSLYLDAPYAVEMMVSNDGGFPGAEWEAYAITKTWEIDFYQSYVIPRTVYVRYRDASGVIYGNFTDDIIYDPNEPFGGAIITDVGTGTVSLLFDLQDDLSGVSEMLIAVGGDWGAAQWEPYSAWKTVSAQPGDIIYVDYRDAAGNGPLYPLELQVPGPVFLPLVLKNLSGGR